MHHRPEAVAGQPSTGALDITRHRPYLRVRELGTGRQRPFQPLPQVPGDVEAGQLQGLSRLVENGQVAGIKSLGAIQVMTQAFAHDERPKNIRCAFTDPVHLGIAHQLFDTEGRFSSQALRLCGFISHAAEENLGIAEEANRMLGAKDLGHGGFDPDIVPVLIGESPHQHGQGLHGKKMSGHVPETNLLRLAFGQRLLEGDSRIGPIQGWLPGLFRHAEANGRDADSAPHIENGEGILQPLAHLADHVLDRDLHLLQRDVGVLDAATAFKLAPLPHAQARRGHVEDKGRVDSIVRPLSFVDGHPFDSSVPQGLSKREQKAFLKQMLFLINMLPLPKWIFYKA